MKFRLPAASVVGLLLIAVAASPAFATSVSIDTNPLWNGSTFISSFGVVNTATYGQTIAVPLGMTSLDSFSFQINSQGVAIVFRAEVYAWNGTMATGAGLYESAPVTATADSNFHVYSFAPGIPVNPGQTYVIFCSTSKDQVGAPPSAGRWGALTNNTTYPDGQFVFINNGPNPAQWTTSAWSSISEDLAFTVSFSGSGVGSQDVPALSGPMLLALMAALAIAGALALRFRHS